MSLGGGGSPSTATSTVDKEYKAGMLALSEEQQGWAREMFGVFKHGVPTKERYSGGRKLLSVFNRPPRTSELQYMQNVINANQSLLGEQTALEQSQMGLSQAEIAAKRKLLPGQTGLARAGIGLGVRQIVAETSLLPGRTALERSRMGIEKADIAARHELLPGQTALSKLQSSDTMAGIRERAPVRSKFFEEASEGVNVRERMNLAQADIAQGFAGAEGTARRNAARMGLNPANIDFSKMATNRAKGIGFARTKARVSAKDESFRRLQSAMGTV